MRILVVLILATAAACTAGGGTAPSAGPPREPAGVPTDERRLGTADADDSGPQIACAGDLVCAVWRSDLDLWGRVVFARSLDGGRTWEDPRPVSRNPRHGDARAPLLCFDEGVVHVAWEDDRDGPPSVRYTRSMDGGATWPDADVRLDDGHAERPIVACAGATVVVVWHDRRNGPRDVYLNRSLDAGATWLGQDVRVNTNPPGASEAAGPLLAVTPASVVVVWEDDRDGETDLYATRSLDRGTTWLPAEVRVDRDPPGRARSDLGHLIAAGDEVWCVWRDFRRGPLGGASDVYLSRATDGGAVWLAGDVRVNTPGAHAVAPRLARSSGGLYVAWADDREGDPDVYVARSRDDGLRFDRPERRVTRTAPGASPSFRPRIRADGDRVDVVWEDARSGRLELFATRSDDAGITWLDLDRRVDDDLEDPRLFRDVPGQTLGPRMCRTDSVPLVMWHDERRGLRDIYVRALAGP